MSYPFSRLDVVRLLRSVFSLLLFGGFFFLFFQKFNGCCLVWGMADMEGVVSFFMIRHFEFITEL